VTDKVLALESHEDKRLKSCIAADAKKSGLRGSEKQLDCESKKGVKK
jgi:hypothetical protein